MLWFYCCSFLRPNFLFFVSVNSSARSKSPRPECITLRTVGIQQQGVTVLFTALGLAGKLTSSGAGWETRARARCARTRLVVNLVVLTHGCVHANSSHMGQKWVDIYWVCRFFIICVVLPCKAVTLSGTSRSALCSKGPRFTRRQP